MFTLRLLGGLALEDDDGVVAGRAAQKRRLALLAVLATAPARTLTRDKLIGRLWPESETEQARHLLSVALYELRKALGDLLVTRGDDVALEGDGFRTDVERFESALDGEEFERGVELYAGPFLDGFYLSESTDFEQWVDGERERLARRFRGALEALAEGRARAGDARGAVEAWHRLAAVDPYNSRYALQLVRAMAATGDRAGALQQLRVHEILLREEFGAEPAPELVALAAQLREEPAPMELPLAPPPDPVVLSPEEVPVAESVAAPEPLPEPAAVAVGMPPVAVPAPPRRRWRPWPGALIAVSIAGVIAVATAAWYGMSTDREEAGLTSVAVLPLADVSPSGDNEYFSDGLTEEIINVLSTADELQVAARTSTFAFRDRGLDVREVGEQLGVRTVLEGSVRKAGDRLRITLRLVDVESGYELWGQTYDRGLGDVFEVQAEIAREVLGALRGELAGAPQPIRSSTADPEAYNLYLRGRYHWYRRTPADFQKAIGYFEQAVARDPAYALAYTGLADAYILLGAYDYGVLPPREAYPRARAALARALELDPASAEAHAGLGDVLLTYDWDWQGAEREFRRALELNPGYAPAHHWYALDLMVLGRPGEALAAIRRARELEPLSLVMTTGMARILYFARDYPASVAEYRRALEMDSTFVTARLGLGLALLQDGKPEEAIGEYRAALRLLGVPHPAAVALLAHAQARHNQQEEARAALAQLMARSEDHYLPPEYVALVHLGLGDREQTLTWLERAYQNRSGSLAFIGIEPLLDPLRGDPRFQALQRRVGR